MNFFLRMTGLLCLAILPNVEAGLETNKPPKFTGMPSCSSTSCHGGASDDKNQCLIWSKQDFHSRAYATLTTARSERLAEILKIEDATKSPQCTSCHAPFQTVPEKLLAAGIKITQGVSCESCHSAAEPWLLSHTRPDFSHEDRVASGLRDLRNLYVRANTCVACHQTLEADVAAAGHPELIFELDGQSIAQPKHWREREPNSGPKAWFIGQVVALREMSWQLSREKNPDQKLLERWSGLLWLVQTAGQPTASLPELRTQPETEFSDVQKQSDQLARKAAEIKWTKQLTYKTLQRLTVASADFEVKDVPKEIQARRAERLVLALDRLTTHAGLEAGIDQQVQLLFSLVQSLPDFDSARFAKELEKLSAMILP